MPLASGAASIASDPLPGQIQLTAAWEEFAQQEPAASADLTAPHGMEALPAPGGSLLMVNHERWNFPRPEPDVDVIGLRWVATF